MRFKTFETHSIGHGQRHLRIFVGVDMQQYTLKDSRRNLFQDSKYRFLRDWYRVGEAQFSLRSGEKASPYYVFLSPEVYTSENSALNAETHYVRINLIAGYVDMRLLQTVHISHLIFSSTDRKAAFAKVDELLNDCDIEEEQIQREIHRVRGRRAGRKFDF